MAARPRLTADIAVGARVTVTGNKGLVKFVGPTEFAAGDWIGVELDSAEGKNDGSVNGVVYFTGREGHGLFVKKAQVRLDRSAALATTASTAAEAKSDPPTVTSVPNSTAGRASSRLAAIREKNKALKESLAAGRMSPNTSLRSSFSGLRPPRGESSQADLNNPGSPASIVSIGSASSDHRKTPKALRGYSSGGLDYWKSFSLADDSRGGEKSGAASIEAAGSAEGFASTGSSTPSAFADMRAMLSLRDAENHIAELEAQLASKDLSTSPSPATLMPPPSTPTTRQSAVDDLHARTGGATREAEEAKTRLEDADIKLNASETRCRDLEARLSLLQKMSENALGEERVKASLLAREKVAAAAASRRQADMESQIAELTDACEALTLDKEQLALEKEDLQEKQDELRMELDSLQLDLEHAQLSSKENEAAARALRAAGGAAGSDGSVDVKMLAEDNMQLREALKRLHSHSLGEKTELTKAVRTLEKEAASHVTLKEELEKMQAWKRTKVAEIEDLMEQLDESKAYEEMVEALTAKNLELGERCGELEATIADLESSVELSEELEVQQAEDIRELQADLTSRDVRLHNQQLEIESMMKELEDTKQTIDRFREYAEQLKASRDDLVAVATPNVGSTALTIEERRMFLKQKASIQQQATESRRAKVSERILQLALMDARARSSRISMLLPGSLLVAETELRCAEVDLSVCRLAGKASLALELLELPAMEFIDALARVKAADAYKDTDADIEATPPLDRTAAMEDCARFALEADESQVIAKIVGEALKLLNVTTRNGGTASSKGERIVSCTGLLSDEIAIVSAEVASAVTEAEGLVDGLLRVIEDEGGLPRRFAASTLATLSSAAESMSTRRAASIVSVMDDSRTDRSNRRQTDAGRNEVKGDTGAAVALLHDCLVWARRATLAATGAALRDAESEIVSTPPEYEDSDGHLAPCQALRGLWGDLIILRSVSSNGSGSWSDRLRQLALGATGLLTQLHTYFDDSARRPPAAGNWVEQILRLRVEAKDLARSAPAPIPSREGTPAALDPVPPCPGDMWMAVAPLLQHDIPTAPSDGNGGNGSWAGLMAPCVERAEKVRSSLEQAIDLKPALEACRVHTEDLERELEAKGKELLVATSKGEQLEALLDKATGAQATCNDLEEQVLRLQEKSSKIEQENKFMAEALDDLQDSTSRLEAENRTLRIGASPAQRAAASGSWKSGKVTGNARMPNRKAMRGPARLSSLMSQGQSLRGWDVTLESSTSSGETPAVGGALANEALSVGYTPATAQETEASLAMALRWSQAEVARWRGKNFSSILAGLRPLPHLSPAGGGRPRPCQIRTPATRVSGHASDSLRELNGLSKKLAAARGPPRVVRVRGAKRASGIAQDERSHRAVDVCVQTVSSADDIDAGHSSLAGAEWQEQKVHHARLEKEWREGQGRASRTLLFLHPGPRDGGADGFGESIAVSLPTPQGAKGDSSQKCVARLRLPAKGRGESFTLHTDVPVMLGRSSLARLQQALAV